MKTANVDYEWIALMKEAMSLGLTKDEIKAYINELKENPHANISKFK